MRIFDGIWIDFQSYDGRGGLRQFSRAVAGSRTRIQHAAPVCKAPREGVTRDMLTPEVVIHLAGNYALASELNQLSAPHGTEPRQVALDSGLTPRGTAGEGVRRFLHQWDSSAKRW